MCLHAQSAVIENGFEWLPNDARWLAGAIAELTAVPWAAMTTDLP